MGFQYKKSSRTVRRRESTSGALSWATLEREPQYVSRAPIMIVLVGNSEDSDVMRP